jgi:hypothetical protein
MANLIKWNVDSTTKVNVFPGAASDSASDLPGMLTAKSALSSAIENTDGSQYAMFELHQQTQATTSSGYWNLWIIRSLDGTTFEDATGATSGGTPITPARPADLVIPVRDLSTTQQIIVTTPILIPPQDFKVYMVSALGTTTTTAVTSTPTDATCSLFITMFNDEVQ